MAAVHLHNSLFSRIQTDHRESLAHSRNFSSLSNAPLLTNTTFQPSEPLLQTSPDSVSSKAYYDHNSRRARHDDGMPALSPWDDSLAHTTFTTPVAEKGRSGCRRRKSQQRHGLIKSLLELIMGSWSIYITIRYFLALRHYGNPSVHAMFLALGASSVVSSVSIIGCMLLATFWRRLLFGPYHPAFSILLSSLRIISYLCLLGPAIVNFTFIFLWRYSADPNLNIRTRCHLDVDAIWTISSNICVDNAPSWTLWVALASIRLAITFAIIAIYHTIIVLHPDSFWKRSHLHHRSDVSDNAITSLAPIPLLRDRQPSDLTLDATLVGESPPRQFSRKHLAHSRSSEMSTEGLSVEPLSFQRSLASPPEVREAERDATTFVDRFRFLITQINREMDSALEVARSDGTLSPDITDEIAYTTDATSSHDPNQVEPIHNDCYDHIHDDTRNNLNLPPVPPSLGYNEFGLPYPPDENIRILNGFIRRMPTIESMGSGEATTSLSSHRPNGSVGHCTHSRPPTRTTLLTVSTNTNYDTPGSNSSSRTNSLSQPMEMSISPRTPISATSEYGELLGRVDRRLSTPSSADFLYGTTSTATHESSGSRSTTASYHTAAMGGSYSPKEYDGFFTA